ncbi:MobB-like homing endonuclease [Salmonella phage Melville]|uniref:MobB-like homing endonuclease n=1 Tax=Salmonella phage Melville TaxID=2041413 RepID=A0A2D1GM98_9CAUD|nr:homing endonuclease [Salmonella phage Melville]ATN93192.1 MobB-like homing endonuclease [Salmonella phage Melville]
MNYQRIYDSLMERLFASPFIGYTENHHIIPRCMGGSDDKDNLVALSAREHFIAHQLLYKIHKTYGLLCAITLMCTDKSGNRINNRLYAWHRERFSEESSKYMKEYLANNPHPKGMLGKKHSKDSLEKIKLPLIKRAEEVSVTIHKFDLDGNSIETFPSISEAAKSVNGNGSNIKYCAEGHFQYAYGFRWSYSLTPNFDKIKPRNYKGARGKICINDGFKNKLIESSETIPEGWIRGRAKVNK